MAETEQNLGKDIFYGLHPIVHLEQKYLVFFWFSERYQRSVCSGFCPLPPLQNPEASYFDSAFISGKLIQWSTSEKLEQKQKLKHNMKTLFYR